MASKCKSLKKDGTVCRANAQPVIGYCVFHDPERALEGSRARREGGLARSRPARVLPLETADVQISSPNDVVCLLSLSISQVRRGEMDARIANAVGYLSSILLKALDENDLEERIAKIEAVLNEQHGE